MTISSIAAGLDRQRVISEEIAKTHAGATPGPDALFTRIYLPCGPAVGGGDPLLSAQGARERRAMVAACEADGSLRFDLHLQGPLETPLPAFPGHSGYGLTKGLRR